MTVASIIDLVNNYAEKNNSKVYLLSNSIPKDLREKKDVTIEEVFEKTKHVIIPLKEAKEVDKFAMKLAKHEDTWPYGDTSLGSEALSRFFFPETKKAFNAAKKNEWEKAATVLSSISLALFSSDRFFQDNDIYAEKEFLQMFKQFEEAWRLLLTQEEYKNRQQLCKKAFKELNNVLEFMEEQIYGGKPYQMKLPFEDNEEESEEDDDDEDEEDEDDEAASDEAEK